MIHYKTHNCVGILFLVAASGFLCVLIWDSNSQDNNSALTDSQTIAIPETLPVLNHDLALSEANETEALGDSTAMPFVNSMDNLGQELRDGISPIEIESDAENSANLASAAEVPDSSDPQTKSLNYPIYSSTSGNGGAASYSTGITPTTETPTDNTGSGTDSGSGTGSGSGSGSGGTSGTGSGSGGTDGTGSGSGTGTGTGSGGTGGTGSGTGTGTGTGGSGDPNPGNGGSIFPDPDEEDDPSDPKDNGTSTPKSYDPNDLICLGLQRNRSHFNLIGNAELGCYFAPNFIWDVRVFTNQAELFRMTAALRKANPGTILGSYASSCLTMKATDDTYPPAKLPLEQCNPDWMLRDASGKTVSYPNFAERLYLDMRLPEVRAAMINLAIARAQFNGLDAVCFDNCYWGIRPMLTFPVSQQEWNNAYMSFYQEAGQAAHDAGLKCIINVATTADKIADAFRAIAPFVDGMMSEMAFHPNVRSPSDLARELKGYEDLLKQGKTVLLIPRYKEDEKFALTQIRPLAQQYRNIYLTASGDVHDEPLYYLPQTGHE